MKLYYGLLLIPIVFSIWLVGGLGFMGIAAPDVKIVSGAEEVITTTTTPTTPTTTPIHKLTIETFNVNLKEWGTNKWTQVTGNLEVYPEDQDPKAADSEYIDVISLASGSGSSTNATLDTDTAYRVVYNGGGTYYDYDLGIITFPYANYNPNTATYELKLEDIVKIGTITDMLNCTAITGDVDGVTAQSTGTYEMDLVTGADDTCMYDESVGNGDFYVKVTHEVTVANSGLKEPVLCFEWDTSNPPEGDEVSAITVQHLEGTDYFTDAGVTGRDFVDYWTYEECITMGDFIEGGASGKYKYTITVDETALDTTDEWKMYFDDLGEIRGKDAKLNTGQTGDSLKFDAQA